MSHEQAISAAADWVWMVLVTSAWKSAVFLLLAFVVVRLLDRRSAAARHLVWTVAMAALLIAPLLAALLPAWRVPVPAGRPSLSLPTVTWPAAVDGIEMAAVRLAAEAVASHEGTDRALSLLDQTPVATMAEDPSAVSLTTPSDVGIRTITRVRVMPLRTWLVAAWLLGAVWILARVAAGVARLRRLEARCERVVEGRLFNQVEDAARMFSVDRQIILLVDIEQTIPMTWGWRKPVLLLPQEATNWPAERSRMVVLHEVAHIARGDYGWQLVGALARGVYWFNPLAWLGFERLKAELEQACDDRVLGAGADAMAYASELLQITSQLKTPGFAPSAALAIGRAARIRRRLESILDESRNRRRLSRRSVCSLALAGMALTAVLASWQGFQLRAAEKTDDASAAAQHASQITVNEAAADQIASEEAKTAAPAASVQPDVGSRLTGVRARILQNSVMALDGRALDEAAIRGMLESLNDPHSEYLPKQKLHELTQSLAGELMGIGAQLKVEEKQLIIVTPLPGSPAHTAGLKPRDAILAVDGKRVAELGANAAIAAIRGPAGTVVTLQVMRADGGEDSVKVTRGAIRMPSIRGLNLDESGKWTFWLDQEAKLGYVGILEFGKQTATECRAALKALMQDGLKGLVIDLRHSPGGMLDAVAETASLLLRDGKIVTVKGGQHPETTLAANGRDVIGDLPLLVLIDDRTASAAEILAGALKDNGRATLIGMRTFGKGSVQSILSVDDEEAIKLTIAYFYLPSGRNIDRQSGADVWGVDPTDGFYIQVTAEQQERWRQARQGRTILDGGARGIPAKGGAAITAAIEKELADPQLAAAYKSLSARVSGGGFLKVGKSEAEMKAFYTRRETLLRQKTEALKQLETIEKELTTESGAKN